MGTCPLLKHTCVSSRVGDEEKKEWMGKNKASKEEETSDNIQRMQLTQGTRRLTMHVTCIAVSLDQLDPKMHMRSTSENWQLFLFEYKNSLRPLANNSLSCSLDISY